MTETARPHTFRDEIARSLLSAHIPIPAGRYLHYGQIVTLLAAFLYIVFALLLSLFGIEISVIPFLPYGVNLAIGFAIVVFLT